MTKNRIGNLEKEKLKPEEIIEVLSSAPGHIDKSIYKQFFVTNLIFNKKIKFRIIRTFLWDIKIKEMQT